MFPIVDVSGWELDTMVSATGRREKHWLIEPRARRYALFKLPRYHSAESAAEKMASEIARCFGIPAAEAELAVRNGRYGVISYKFLEPGESLVEGGDLILSREADFDRFGARVHSFQVVEDILTSEEPSLLPGFIEMLVLDAAIGNSDRHHDNWGVIRGSEHRPRLAPAYDHGSSLGSHIDEGSIETYLAPDHLDRYRKAGQSRVGWREDGSTRRLRHLALLERIYRQRRGDVAAALVKVLDTDLTIVSRILGRVPDAFAGAQRRQLVEEIIRRRMVLLREVLSGEAP